MSAEEPNPTPEMQEEPAAAAEAQPAEPQPAATEQPDRAAALAKLPDVLREAFADDHDEEELDAVAAGLTVDDLRKLPPSLRAAARALVRQDVARVKAHETTVAEREKAFTEEKAKFAADQREHRKREAALLAMAASPAAADPGAAPQVDPFTPEGQAALAEYYARKANAATFAPLRADARAKSESQYWDDLVERYADLGDQKVADEFGDFVSQLNEGVDPEKVRAGIERPRIALGLAAELFFSRREREAAKTEKATRQAAADADRAEAARAVGRGGHGGVPDLLSRYDALKKQDEDAAFDLLNSNPAVKKAVLERNGVSLH